ncbi:3695_t:CDS:2 [Rhizophagus irregularis]|nr:3695_t:CDS:2 [Rhizophagus irregularis]
MGIGNPYDIRNRAMNDLIKVYSSTFASALGSKESEYSFLWKVKSSKSISHTLGYDSRLVMNKLGEFYLCIPRPLELRTENQGLFIVNEEQRRTRINRLCHAYNKIQIKKDTLHVREYLHCKVIICSEDYTSKTCGSCGLVNDELGGLKTFKCEVLHLAKEPPREFKTSLVVIVW